MHLRAAFHVHSDWSYDGRWTLDEITRAFAARGYDCILTTEHDQGFSEDRWRAYRDACQKASTDGMLVVPGIEYSDPANTVHTLVWGDIPFLGTGRDTRSVLEEAVSRGGACVFAHPSRKAAWELFRPEWLKYLSGIEVWNRKTDGWAPSRDALRLVSENSAPPIVGLDFHSSRQFSPLRMRLPIAGQATETSILDVLQRRACRCEVWGRDLALFTGGFGLSTVTVLEACRRPVARTLRSVIREPLGSRRRGKEPSNSEVSPPRTSACPGQWPS